jgi:anthranilate synthase/aminodeoxychorismate synthase-like glutamine amidotransferase
MSVLILDNYDSFTYNLYQVMQAQTDEPIEVLRNDEIDFDEIVQRRPSRIVLSPGPGHPKNQADFGVCREVVTCFDQLGCPVLGVCLGHQGIAQFLGGTLIQAPQIVHGKTSLVNITHDSPLFEGLSNPFRAMRYHSLLVSDQDFPADLIPTAHEATQGLIMALQHRSKPLYGVQFHPESIGTPEGARLLRNFLTITG